MFSIILAYRAIVCAYGTEMRPPDTPDWAQRAANQESNPVRQLAVALRRLGEFDGRDALQDGFEF